MNGYWVLTKNKPQQRWGLVGISSKNHWQEWLEEDRTFLSVDENAILTTKSDQE